MSTLLLSNGHSANAWALLFQNLAIRTYIAKPKKGNSQKRLQTVS